MKTFILFIFGLFEDHEDIEFFTIEVLGSSKHIKSVRYVIENSKNIIVIFDSEESDETLSEELDKLLKNDSVLFYFLFEKDGLITTYIPEKIKDIIFKPTDGIRKIQIDYREYEKPPIDLDEILDKVNQHGVGSLTPEEKKYLDDFEK